MSGESDKDKRNVGKVYCGKGTRWDERLTSCVADGCGPKSTHVGSICAQDGTLSFSIEDSSHTAAHPPSDFKAKADAARRVRNEIIGD